MTSLRSRTIASLALWIVSSSASAAEGILPQSLVVSLQIEEVFEYRCPSSAQCQIRCASVVGEPVTYQNVRRAELASSESYWAFAAVYMDSLGKGHRTSGFLPKPASCVFDDLEFSAAHPVIDGTFGQEPAEVIFELSPSN